MDAAFRLLIWAGWTAALLPFQIVAVGLDLEASRRIPVIYHRGNLHLFRIRVIPHGTRERRHAALLVANHSSYFDIPVLAALVGGSFVAKAEIRTWPLIGFLARLQSSVFIDRRVAATRDARDKIRGRLAAGDDLILFPEGTTGDGVRLLPFRTALFAIADAGEARAPLVVQPVTVAYTHQNGLPIGPADRAKVAWFGDASLASHFWSVIRGGPLTVTVIFHPPVDPARFPSRKALAAHCEGEVARGLEEALPDHPATAAA